MKTALTIAGSDCSGGAGIQADIKTILAHGVYAMSVVTALTAQNTCGVFAIHDVPSNFLKQQLDAVFEDIRPDAVKIGMIGDSDRIHTIADRLRFYRATRVVLDPVIVATSGAKLMQDSAIEALKDSLFPLSAIITPNIAEAEVLTGLPIRSHADMEQAAKKIADRYSCAVLIKGGHRQEDADDLLYENGEMIWLSGERIDNPNTHGTGCTLSSAIAANLAKGLKLRESVALAKHYVRDALCAHLNLGKQSGPLDHGYSLQGKFITKNQEDIYE